ncbi:ATP-dependent DNA helicase pif1 [Glycine soja]
MRFAENMRELCLILIYIATVYAFLFVLMPTTVCMHVFVLAFMFLFSSNFFCRIALICHCLQNQKVMSRKENLISELHTRKGTWKIAMRITDLWQARKQNSKQTIEMVLMDQTIVVVFFLIVGSKIGATLWQELFTELRDKLQCGSSYLIQNLRIVDNQSEYRVSPAPYLVYLLKTTSVKEIHHPEIPSNVYLITPFTDIISGLAPCHTLVDIVGVVVDLIDVKTVNPPHRMTVRLRDNNNCDILITVWEDNAIQLHDAIDKNLLFQEPLVVMLTLGKIKDATDKYPLSVQNIKFGSKLYVNADITEIHKFRQSLSVPFYSGGIINDKDVDEIIIDAPWSYDSCPNCTTTFDPSKGGSACRSCHTSVIDTIPRMEHNGDKGNFLLWDATCIKLFGKTAGECRDELIAAGDDIKVFPKCVDEILLKTWAVRFKFRSQLRQSSVLDVSEELHHIQSLIATLGLKEQSSKGKGIVVEPETSCCRNQLLMDIYVERRKRRKTILQERKRQRLATTDKHERATNTTQHNQFVAHDNSHSADNDAVVAEIKPLMDKYAEQRKRRQSILQERKKQRSATNENLQSNSQCSPTINHNNNPAKSFQSTPPSHGTLSIDDSERCSKRHIVNVSCIQRNLMSSFEHKKIEQLLLHPHAKAHDQFVGHDNSDSTDDDVNMTQENIDIEYSLNDPTIDDLDDYDEQTFLSASSAYQNTGGTYIDIGDPIWECPHCKAMIWYDERINKDKQTKDPKTKNFQQYIRIYNLMFAFTSPGIKFDKSYNTGKGPPTFRIHRQTHHLIGSLLPMPNNPPKFAQLYIYDTDNEIINRLSQNPFRMARDKLHYAAVPDLKMKLISQRQTDGRLYNLPTTTEVVSLIVGDEHSADKRDIIIEKKSGLLKRIHELHPAYLPLQYPLLYPKGEDGYKLNIPHKDHANIDAAKRKQVTLCEYFCYHLQSRTNEAQTILHSRRLFQQWIIDGYCMIEPQKLNYVRQHQQQLRVDKYINLTGSNDHLETLGRDRGKRIILPSSFVGSQRYMEQLYFDGMEICGHLGFPDLFLTMTCNPTWPEIQRKVTQSNLTPNNCPDIITRFITDIYTIEWQKRGLPHAYILIFLHPSNKLPNPLDIDQMISAEIPDKQTQAQLFEIVSNHMMHGPCGFANKKSPCMVNGKCIGCFPKKFHGATIVDQDGFPIYRRRNDGRTVMKNGIELDNRFVVPYNPQLLLKYKTHLNMEWCNQSTSIKYLFKYINKGSDLSPPEACWKIFAFPMHARSPAVERLYFHLENQQHVYWTDDQQIGEVLSKNTIKESMFTAWMHFNKICSYGRDLTYHQYISRFVYVARKRCWQPRKQGNTIGRLIWVPPSAGELFYLRMMLSTAKGAQSYSDIRTVNGLVYPTFREACFAKGFLGSDQEFISALQEANNWGTAHYLRKLFVKLLFLNTMDRPKYVWQQTWQWMTDDIIFNHRKQGIRLTKKETIHLCLTKIENMLQANRRSLRDFPSMPYPIGYARNQHHNNLIHNEMAYDKEMLAEQYNTTYQLLTATVYFLYGYGGTGKTFVWIALSSGIRSNGGIVCTVALSGITSLLLPGGRTTHSKFAIPVPTTENSTCNIHQGSELAELLKVTKLIVWDEAPMCHKFAFEALDKSLKDIMQNNLAFGGKIIVFGGDFRQILPIVPKGNRSDIVHATINASYIWDH